MKTITELIHQLALLQPEVPCQEVRDKRANHIKCRHFLRLPFLLLLTACTTPTAKQPTTIALIPTATATVPVASTPHLTPNATIINTSTTIATSSTTLTPSKTPTITLTKTPSATQSTTPSVTNTPAPTLTSTPTRRPTITPTPLPTNTATPANQAINQLSSGMTGVTMIGNVVFTSSFAKGFKFTLSDGSGQIVLLLWHDMYDSLPQPWNLNYGARVQVRGDVGSFEGQTQIVPVTVSDLTIISGGGLGAGLKSIGELNAGILGQRVLIAGIVQSSSENNGGIKLKVSDGSGEIEVFIWHTIFNRIPNNGALRQVGSSVRIAGILDEFRGELEIVPAIPYDVQIQ